MQSIYELIAANEIEENSKPLVQYSEVTVVRRFHKNSIFQVVAIPPVISYEKLK